MVFSEYEVSFLFRVYHYCVFFSGVAQGLTTFSVRCLWLNVLAMYCLHVITAYWNHRKTNGGKYLYKFIIRERSISITTKKGWGKHRLDADKLFPFRIDLFLCFCFTITFLVSGVVNDNIYNNDNNNNYVSFYIIIFNFAGINALIGPPGFNDSIYFCVKLIKSCIFVMFKLKWLSRKHRVVLKVGIFTVKLKLYGGSIPTKTRVYSFLWLPEVCPICSRFKM